MSLPDSRQVKWFWECVDGFSKEERRALLQFSTASSNVPVGGFSRLQSATGMLHPFTLSELTGRAATNTLPRAAACFNTLYLPAFDSLQQMRERIKVPAASALNFPASLLSAHPELVSLAAHPRHSPEFSAPRISPLCPLSLPNALDLHLPLAFCRLPLFQIAVGMGIGHFDEHAVSIGRGAAQEAEVPAQERSTLEAASDTDNDADDREEADSMVTS